MGFYKEVDTNEIKNEVKTAIENELNGIIGSGTKIKHGVFETSMPVGKTLISYTISFTEFSNTPTVVATARHNSNSMIYAKIRNVTTKSAIIDICTPTNITQEFIAMCEWIAIGI